MFKFDHVAFEEWLLTGYWPVMGAETLEDEDDTGDAGGKPDSAGSGDADSNSDEGDDTGDDGADDDEGGAAGDADEAVRLRTQLEKSRTELAAAQNAVAKAKAEARKAREEAAKKGGNWEHVAQERATEIEELNERLTNAERERLTAVEELDSFRREVRVTRLATKFGFRDPQDAINSLSAEVTGDDKTAERALKKLSQEKPYLVDSRRPRGRGMNGNGNGGGDIFTKEELDKMSSAEMQAQITSNPDKVNRSLKAIGAGGG